MRHLLAVFLFFLTFQSHAEVMFGLTAEQCAASKTEIIKLFQRANIDLVSDSKKIEFGDCKCAEENNKCILHYKKFDMESFTVKELTKLKEAANYKCPELKAADAGGRAVASASPENMTGACEMAKLHATVVLSTVGSSFANCGYGAMGNYGYQQNSAPTSEKGKLIKTGGAKSVWDSPLTSCFDRGHGGLVAISPYGCPKECANTKMFKCITSR